jgi:ethanolamine kinase
MSDRRPPVVIPSSDLFVSRESVDSFVHGIRAAAIQFVPAFAGLSPDDEDALKVEQLSGGITNALFKVFQPDVEGKPLDGNSALVRIFGDKTELVIDRVREEALMDQLLAYQVGTPLYGRFANGRVEHFLPGRSLTPDDMTDPSLTPLIASALAHVHSVRVIASIGHDF